MADIAVTSATPKIIVHITAKIFAIVFPLKLFGAGCPCVKVYIKFVRNTRTFSGPPP
jgi:hypothetical protein